MAPPKKGLALLLGPSEESEGSDPAEMAANGIIEAIEAGDAVELAEALRTFINYVSSEE